MKYLTLNRLNLPILQTDFQQHFQPSNIFTSDDLCNTMLINFEFRIWGLIDDDWVQRVIYCLSWLTPTTKSTVQKCSIENATGIKYGVVFISSIPFIPVNVKNIVQLSSFSRIWKTYFKQWNRKLFVVQRKTIIALILSLGFIGRELFLCLFVLARSTSLPVTIGSALCIFFFFFKMARRRECRGATANIKKVVENFRVWEL